MASKQHVQGMKSKGEVTVCPVNNVRYRDFDALTLETLGLQGNKQQRGKRGEVCDSHGNIRKHS